MTVKTNILIVDDEKHLQLNLVTFLEDEGYDVVTAADGETGIDRVCKRKFDIGIIDMRLPGMDGNMFILKAHQIQPDMKFLIHTGSVTYTIPQSLIDIGISKEHVFLKPVIDMSAMISAIEKILH